jgi:hypothetical protein
VLRLERFSVVGEHDLGFSSRDVVERHVRRVAAVAELDGVRGRGLDALEERVEHFLGSDTPALVLIVSRAVVGFVAAAGSALRGGTTT